MSKQVEMCGGSAIAWMARLSRVGVGVSELRDIIGKNTLKTKVYALQS